MSASEPDLSTPDAAELGADGTRKYSRDNEIEDKLAEYLERHSLSPLDALNDFPVYARRTTLKRFLAHYELFRHTVDLPGDIVELGVFKGHSLLSWANFLEARNIGDRTKKVWGFDNFRGFGEMSPEDGPEYSQVQKSPGGYSPEPFYQALVEAIEIFDQDRFVPWKKRIELIVGDVEETVPAFVEQHPGIRISLLHFDVDLYRPTMVGLEHFLPRVVQGGVVVFDEYGVLEWGGESSAVEEYLAERGQRLRKFEWNNIPGAYFIKD